MAIPDGKGSVLSPYSDIAQRVVSKPLETAQIAADAVRPLQACENLIDAEEGQAPILGYL